MPLPNCIWHYVLAAYTTIPCPSALAHLLPTCGGKPLLLTYRHRDGLPVIADSMLVKKNPSDIHPISYALPECLQELPIAPFRSL